MGHKKKFIDKKNSHTFQLMARDSTDPAFTQSDRIFVRVDNNPLSANSIFADSPDDPDAEFDNYDEFGDGSSRPLSEDVRKEILALGFPDDGYNYLNHLREIKNSGGGSNFFSNPKFKLEHVSDVKAYDASKVRIKEAEEEPEENILYSVASNTANVRVQRAVDPEVAALLDDSDASRFDSDVEDLEEDFVVQANLCEDEDDEENAHTFNGNNFDEESMMNRSLNNEHVLPVSAYSAVADASGPLDGGLNGATGVHSAGEQPRPRRMLDVQFDLLERQEYGSDDNSDGDDDYYADYEENYQAEDKSLAEKLKVSLSNHVTDSLELDENGKPKLDDSGKYKVPNEEKEQDDFAADVIRRCKEYGEQYEVQDDDKDVVIFEESSDESEVWDCETIVSTYSNLDNHPGTIEIPGFTRKKKLTETVTAAFSSSNPIISLRGKAKLPADFLPGSRKPAAEKVKDVSTEKIELYKRKKHGLESKEEKKERKAAVKEERREARRTKKETKELYKCEANRAQRTAAGSGASSYHIF